MNFEHTTKRNYNNEITEQTKVGLHAIDFIEKAIISINSLNDLKEYKDQLLQASNDIKESLQYIKNICEQEQIKQPKVIYEYKASNIKPNSNIYNNKNINQLKPTLFYDYSSINTFEDFETKISNSNINQNNNVHKNEDDTSTMNISHNNYNLNQNIVPVINNTDIKVRDNTINNYPTKTYQNNYINSNSQINTNTNNNSLNQVNTNKEKTNENKEISLELNNSIENKKINENLSESISKYRNKRRLENIYENTKKNNNYNAINSIKNKNNIYPEKMISLQSNTQNIINTSEVDNNDIINSQAMYPQINLTKESISNDNKKKKEKITKVADLVAKINSEPELYELIPELFGNNILDELMSPNVEDDLISNVEQSIKKIEELKKKDFEESLEKPFKSIEPIKQENNLYSVAEKKNEKLFFESNSQNLKKNEIKIMNADELLKSKGFTSKSLNSSINHCTKINRNKKNDYKEFNFQNSLRTEPKLKQTNQRNNSNNYLHIKGFVNYTSPHSHYFDASLQNGGYSKIPTYMNKSKSNRAISPVKEYICGRSNYYNYTGYLKGY